MTKIMILAGGHDQGAFIEELRKEIKDVFIIVLDMAGFQMGFGYPLRYRSFIACQSCF